MEKIIKSKNEIYEEVKKFIENKADKKILIAMLCEVIDNYSDSVYLDLHNYYVSEKN